MKALHLIRRSKVLHVLFWVFSWRSLVHTLLQHSAEANVRVIHHSTTITILFQMIMVYTIVHALLPRLFERGRYGRFVLSALLTVIASAVAAVFVKEAWMRMAIDPGYRLNHSMVIISNLMDSLVLAFIWTVIYVAEALFLKDRRNTMLEQQRLRSELDFLKDQLNPHFLFNTLNGLHVTMRHDMKRAERTLMEFSALLRYQLYECNGPTTTLEKEVEFLRNYIALEGMRQGDDMEVRFDAPEVVPYLELAPFVLIPFVENAFKHVSRTSRRSHRIAIALRCAEGRVELTVENTCDPQPHLPEERKGIGLMNARRRLELLYPQRHTLDISPGPEHHRIHLMIKP